MPTSTEIQMPRLLSWEDVLQPANAKVTDLHYSPLSQRFLVAMTMAKTPDKYDLLLLEHESIKLDMGSELKTANILAVLDFADPKPIGIQLGITDLRAAFRNALKQQYHLDIEKFDWPRDGAMSAYQFERQMVSTYAPEALHALSEKQAHALVYDIAKRHGKMAPDIEFKTLTELRAENINAKNAIAYFSNQETLIGAGKLVFSTDACEEYPEGCLNTHVILHEMAHALTLGKFVGPAHGHTFIHHLASLYDRYTSLDKETFLYSAAQENLIASAMVCPPALVSFDASVRRKYTRSLG